MPIRIEKDPNKGGNRRRRRSSSNQKNAGSGGGLGSIVGMLLPFLMKRPKFLILTLIIAGLWWYFGGGSSDLTNNSDSGITSFDTGAELDEKVYDEALVFEPLADNVKNPLPEKFSLLKYAPKRKNQGKQGSCVGWASSYAARTILHSRATGSNPNSVAFSPSYLYNNIALPECQGSYIKKAMDFMQTKGVAPFSKFAYDEDSCDEKPYQLQSLADGYRINGFERLSKGGNNYNTDLLAIKQNLAQGSPVVIGMMVGGSFMSNMVGKEMWVPTDQDYTQRGFGGHALCVIGYDDYYKNNRGAFQIMNSWGEQWGKKGIFWIDYEDFDEFTKEAYAIHPMGNADAPVSKNIKLNLGIVLNENGENVNFQKVSDMSFRTIFDKQTRFKVEVQNDHECYVYIIGVETDQSTYVLFPYTEKHSPYCGITGSRVFPKDHSLFPDDEGSIDTFIVIATNQPIDYNKLNETISSDPENSILERVKNALDGELAIYSSRCINNMIELDFSFGNKVAVAAFIEVEKR